MNVDNTSYEADFYAWTRTQADALRSGSLTKIDRDHLAQEIESLGGRERREIYSRLVVILTHLVKWDCQPSDRSRSWAGTIRTQRRDLERVLEDSPSLRGYATGVTGEAFEDALDRATEEMGYLTPLKETFKKNYTFDQAMTEDVAP